MTRQLSFKAVEPALERLIGLGPLEDASLEMLRHALQRSVPVAARHELQREGRRIAEPQLVVRGWGARVRILPDRRRQLLSFLLPGDFFGLCEHRAPVAVSSVIALTDMRICLAPSATGLPELRQVYRMSRALEEAHLLAQITRLGRLSAQERLCDLFLELHERLSQCNLADGNSFPMPLTQETLADALGLTTVHLNRMVQQARKEGEIEWRSGLITLIDPSRLAEKIGRVALRVTEIA